MVLIHSWRNTNDDGVSQRPSQQARALHEANCTSILRTIATRYAANPKVPPQAAELVWELLSVFQREGEPVQVTAPQQSPSTLVFFAGAADATAGSGRAGAAIAQVDSRTGGVELLWQAAIPVASTRPAHLHASYAGLLAALTTATQLGLQGPTVIEDNALILRQLHRHRPPRNPELRHLYLLARRIADVLSIRSWRHQYKTHNQLANSLATKTQSPEHASTSSSSDACVNSSTTLRLLHSDTWWPLQQPATPDTSRIE